MAVRRVLHLRSSAGFFGRDRVIFAGVEKRVEALLHDLDGYVSPCLAAGMPLVVLEPLASGVPVIATRVGEVGAMLADGAGCLVPPGAPEALAAAVEEAVTGAWDGAGAARAARECRAERCSARAQGGAYGRLYQQVVGAGG